MICPVCGNIFLDDQAFYGHRHQPSRFSDEPWYDARSGKKYPEPPDQIQGSRTNETIVGPVVPETSSPPSAHTSVTRKEEQGQNGEPTSPDAGLSQQA